MKGEVSPAITDGQGDTEDGEGNVSKIRESHVGEVNGLTLGASDKLCHGLILPLN
jgi:hypothetical protein